MIVFVFYRMELRIDAQLCLASDESSRGFAIVYYLHSAPQYTMLFRFSCKLTFCYFTVVLLGNNTMISIFSRILLISLMSLLSSIQIARADSHNSTLNIESTLQQLSVLSATVAEKALRSVVEIQVTGVSTGTSNGNVLVSRFRSSGSGFVIDPEGYIITNAHVVKGATSIRVDFPARSDESRSSSIVKSRVKPVHARLVGLDEETDIAVLKINRSGLESLPIADSDNVKSGHLAWAVGSPLGLESSVTIGVISTVARQLKADDPMIYIQTDAAVNPGSSGGPLIGSSGEVIGVNASILSRGGGSDGISLAIPSNIMRYAYEQIKEHGYLPRGDIGVNAQTNTPEIQQGLGLPQDYGVILSDVLLGSTALKAGLVPGDVIVSVDGKPMENARQFIVNIYSKEIGNFATLEVIKNGEPVSLDVKIEERRSAPTLFGEGEQQQISEFGILVSNIDGENRLAEKYKRGQGGVLVQAKIKYTNQLIPEIHTKDIIYSVNGAHIFNTVDLRKAVSKLKPGTPVVLHIERNRKLSFVTFYWN